MGKFGIFVFFCGLALTVIGFVFSYFTNFSAELSLGLIIFGIPLALIGCMLRGENIMPIMITFSVCFFEFLLIFGLPCYYIFFCLLGFSEEFISLIYMIVLLATLVFCFVVYPSERLSTGNSYYFRPRFKRKRHRHKD